MHLSRVAYVDTSSRTIEARLIKTLLVNKNWTINVLEDAKILKDGVEVDLSEIQVNDVIRVRGTANRLQKSVDAHTVSIASRLY